MNLVDLPNSRKIHIRPIPLSGGLGIFVPIFIAMIVWLARGTTGMEFLPGLGLVTAMSMITLTGFIDDFRPLSPSKRLLVQAMASFLLWNIGLRLDVIHFGGFMLDLGILSLPLTMLWFMGFMNTSNFMDGMDGLSGGMSLIALGGLLISGGAISSVFGPAVLILALLTGVYLIFNLSSKRKVFLGDSGSLTMGLSIGILAILLARPAAGAGLSWHPLALVLAAYSVGIADVFVSIVRRARHGASVFKADNHHIHHRLLRAGLDWKWTLAALHGLAGLVVFAVSVPRYGGIWALLQFMIPSTAVIGAGVRLLKVGLVNQSIVLPMHDEKTSEARAHLRVAGSPDDDKLEAFQAKSGR